MSTAGGANAVSLIKIVGDDREFRAVLQSTESGLQGMKQKAEASGGGFGSLADSAKKNAAQILGMVGAAGAAVAAIDKLMVSIKEFQNAPAALARDLRDIESAIRAPLGSPEGLDELGQQGLAIRKVADAQREAIEIAKQQRSFYVGLAEELGRIVFGADEYLARLEKINGAERAALNDVDRKTQAKEIADEKKRQLEFDEILLDIRKAIASETEKITMQSDAWLKAGEKIAKTEQERAALQKAVNEASAKAFDDLAKKRDEEHKKELDRIAKEQNARMKAMADAAAALDELGRKQESFTSGSTFGLSGDAAIAFEVESRFAGRGNGRD